ncbi:MAG TPA: glycosyltransferase family 4 protein [Candidatus Kapabacteria bacterium]|nr:glycosyltransferase family 4 protein [Candidatus Kapabacteria bacterium]HYM34472.1 glycosyltransferase family 4 protein [Steroidobacteraceae bacterium]
MTITFVGPAQSRFVRNDIEILSRKHTLRIVDANMGRGKSAALKLLRLELAILKQLFGSDALFFWFADYYSLIPTLIARLFAKKVFVVAGGFDVTYIPEVKSGARVRPMRWFLVRNTHRFATKVFPVSNYAKHLLDTNSKRHAPAEVIYNAVDTKRFLFSSASREPVAITVTQLDIVLDYLLKGIDVFLKVAEAMPDVKFELVGIRGEALAHARKEAAHLSNVTITEGPVSYETLLNYYHTASTYCQLSMDETFGVATAEAMSTGCIPVVSEVPSLREVTGETGYVVNRNDITAIADAIRKSFDASEAQRQACSEYVRKFDIEQRAEMLLAEVR